MDFDGFDLGTEGFSDFGDMGNTMGFDSGPDMGGVNALMDAMSYQTGWNGGEEEDEIIVTGDRQTDDGPSYFTHEFWSNFFSDSFDDLIQKMQQTSDGPEGEFGEWTHDPNQLEPIEGNPIVDRDGLTIEDNEDAPEQEEAEDAVALVWTALMQLQTGDDTQIWGAEYNEDTGLTHVFPLPPEVG